jgi:hypothetical protein
VPGHGGSPGLPAQRSGSSSRCRMATMRATLPLNGWPLRSARGRRRGPRPPCSTSATVGEAKDLEHRRVIEVVQNAAESSRPPPRSGRLHCRVIPAVAVALIAASVKTNNAIGPRLFRRPGVDRGGAAIPANGAQANRGQPRRWLRGG